MQQVAEETRVAFERRLERARVPAPQRPDYQKWVRFYLDFCRKYGHPPRSPTSLGPFLGKLAARHQSVEQRDQAADAIRLLLAGPAAPGASVGMQAARGPACTAPAAGRSKPTGRTPGVGVTGATDAARPSRSTCSAAENQRGRKPRPSLRLAAASWSKPPLGHPQATLRPSGSQPVVAT